MSLVCDEDKNVACRVEGQAIDTSLAVMANDFLNPNAMQYRAISSKLYPVPQKYKPQTCS
jgi:hypothetical protein